VAEPFASSFAPPDSGKIDTPLFTDQGAGFGIEYNEVKPNVDPGWFVEILWISLFELLINILALLHNVVACLHKRQL